MAGGAGERDVEGLERTVGLRLSGLERGGSRQLAGLADRLLPVPVEVVRRDRLRSVLAELVEREVELRHRPSLQLGVADRDECRQWYRRQLGRPAAVVGVREGHAPEADAQDVA